MLVSDYAVEIPLGALLRIGWAYPLLTAAVALVLIALVCWGGRPDPPTDDGEHHAPK